MVANLIIGYHALNRSFERGAFTGCPLEKSLETETGSTGIAVVSTLAIVIFVRSMLDARDSDEMNKIFRESSVELFDSMLFDAILTFSLNAPIFALRFGGQRRVALFLLLDGSRIFFIAGGLFIFLSIRKEAKGVYPFVFFALFVSQVLFFHGFSSGHNPLPEDLMLFSYSGNLHLCWLLIPFSEYVLGFDKLLASHKSGRLFLFNTCENI